MKPITTMLIFLLLGFVGESLGQSPPSVSGERYICEGTTTTLTAIGESGATFNWYEVETGGTSIASGADFTTPILTTNTEYYVDQTTGMGTSSRTKVVVFATPIPSPLQPTNVIATPAEVCEGESTSLSALVDATNYQEVHWYDSLTGGTLLSITDSGEAFVVSPIDTTTYYAQSVVKEYQHVFNYTGGAQTFTVPAGVVEISIDAYGARGGQSFNPGYALGGRVEATMNVTEGQVLNIYVGGAGGHYSGGTTPPPGGWNGGGTGGGWRVGGGGGATDIRINGTTASDRVLVAGGAGGKGYNCGSTHPHGGGLTGASGSYCSSGPGEGTRGHGGSQSAGGRRGCWWSGSGCGGTGGFGNGGNGGNSSGTAGAPGGGGWYGGGGGTNKADGGGGSSYTDPTLFSNVTHTQGANNGHGQLVISYQLGAACASTTRVPVTVNVNEVPSVSVSSDTTICVGSGASLTANGADSYDWIPGNLTGATVNVTPSAATTYTVTGTLSAGGCTAQANVTVSVSEVSVSADVTICEGGSTTLTASNASSYTWEPGGMTGASVTVSPTTTTQYIVTGTEVTGCTTKDTVVVTVEPRPSLTVSPDTTIERGNSVNLTASGADTWYWNPGGGTAASITVSPTVSTTYTVTGTYTSNGCSTAEDVVVSIAVPISISGERRICETESTTLTASGINGASFAWYDAASGGNLIGNTADFTTPALNTTTEYFVEQSFGNYTSSRLRVIVVVNSVPGPISNVAATPSTICEGESADLTASVDRLGLQRVHWYDSLSGGTLLGVTDSGEAFVVSPTDTTTYYAASESESVELTFNYTGSVQTFTVPAGVVEISIDAYGGRGGKSFNPGYALGGRVEATMSVTEGEVLNIYVGGAGGHYTGGTTPPPGGWNGGGTGGSWRVGGGGGATDIRINGTATSDRILVAGGAGGKGYNCGSTQPHGGGLTGVSGSYCSSGPGEGTRGRGGSQTAGGRRGCWWSGSGCGGNGGFGNGGNGGNSSGTAGAPGGGGWYGGGGGTNAADGGGGSSYTHPNLFQNVAHTQGVRDGHGMLVISYTLAASCGGNNARLPVTLNVDPQANLVTNTALQSCPGVTLDLTATGADQYLWTPGDLTGSNIQVTPDTNTTYTLIGSMNTGSCNDTATITVTIDSVQASIDLDTICNGSLVTLNATGATNYTWMPGNLSGASHTIAPTATTTYVVTGTNANGCSTTDSVRVEVVPNSFDMMTTPDTIALTNTKVTLSTNGASSVIWSNGSTTPSIEFLATTAVTYSVTGFDAYGCEDTDVINVTVDDMPEVTGTTIVLKGASTTLTASPPSAFRGGGQDALFKNTFMPTTYAWYDAPSGGNLLGSSETYTTPPLDTNAIYFVEMDDGSGASLRKCITVNVIDAQSTIVNAEQDSLCPSGATNLSGDLENPGVINWYDAPTGGNFLGSSERGASFNITPSNTTTYYGQGETEEYTQTFNYTGAVQTFTVPTGVTSIKVDAYGAAGGNARYTTGGRGGRVEATINVTPGEVLNLYVGGQGASHSGSGSRPGGWNGGGSGGAGRSSGGGGATDIRLNGTSSFDRILVAGGGGGGKASSCSTGAPGAGGNTAAASGGHCYSGNSAGGGSQTGGGGRGCYGSSYCGSNGGFVNGGNGYRYSSTTGGGGGGGGWYGGGGGHLYGNGGGGSSYTNTDHCANVIHTAGAKTGNGQIILTYSLDDTSIDMDSITIDVGDYEDPVPDVASLPNVEAEGSVTLTAPTGMDNCIGALSATTTDPTFYDTPGTYLVDWDYDDGNGNFISQQQTVIVSAVLPIELFSFEGRKKGETVMLDWSTVSELNSKGFEIQRSADAIEWEVLGFVNSQGTTDLTQQYRYIDVDPMTGNNYYRLLLRDLDNSFEYSNIIQVEFRFSEVGISAFPNPTSSGQFTVLISDPSFDLKGARLSVFDQMGRQVIEQAIDGLRTELSTTQLPGGAYTVRIESGHHSWQARVLVIRD